MSRFEELVASLETEPVPPQFEIMQLGEMWFAVPDWSTGDPNVGFPSSTRDFAEQVVAEIQANGLSLYQIVNMDDYAAQIGDAK